MDIQLNLTSDPMDEVLSTEFAFTVSGIIMDIADEYDNEDRPLDVATLKITTLSRLQQKYSRLNTIAVIAVFRVIDTMVNSGYFKEINNTLYS